MAMWNVPLKASASRRVRVQKSLWLWPTAEIDAHVEVFYHKLPGTTKNLEVEIRKENDRLVYKFLTQPGEHYQIEEVRTWSSRGSWRGEFPQETA